LRADADREPPIWGFASSPLVVNDLVIVHAGGEGNRGVLAYDAERGELRWGAPAGGHSYSSPQLLTVAGAPSIVIVTDAGLSLIDPADGAVLFRYAQKSEYRILQPLLVSEFSLLMNSRFDGTSRLDLGRKDGKLSGRERWASRFMKSDFSDYVAHQGYLYGFDISILACIDLETGQRRWKGGRYGHGQVLLLPDAGQLLVTAETGDLVLVRADPERLDEIARIKVLQGKTWNHPVLVGTRLYLRNSQEAVGLELPVLP
jgi:outer membrane protein assembly factor BamB